MKRLLLGLLTLALCLGITACGGNNDAGDSQRTVDEAATATEDAAAVITTSSTGVRLASPDPVDFSTITLEGTPTEADIKVFGDNVTPIAERTMAWDYDTIYAYGDASGYRFTADETVDADGGKTISLSGASGTFVTYRFTENSERVYELFSLTCTSSDELRTVVLYNPSLDRDADADAYYLYLGIKDEYLPCTLDDITTFFCG